MILEQVSSGLRVLQRGEWQRVEDPIGDDDQHVAFREQPQRRANEPLVKANAAPFDLHSISTLERCAVVPDLFLQRTGCDCLLDELDLARAHDAQQKSVVEGHVIQDNRMGLKSIGEACWVHDC